MNWFFFSVQTSWGCECQAARELGVPTVQGGEEEFPAPADLTGLVGSSQRGVSSLGSHLNPGEAAPLIAFQSQFPPPPTLLALSQVPLFRSNCVPELSKRTHCWGISGLLVLSVTEEQWGQSQPARVLFQIGIQAPVGCGSGCISWGMAAPVDRKCGHRGEREPREPTRGNVCNFQLWYLSWALRSTWNYSQEWLLWEFGFCSASFPGVPQKGTREPAGAFLSPSVDVGPPGAPPGGVPKCRVLPLPLSLQPGQHLEVLPSVGTPRRQARSTGLKLMLLIISACEAGAILHIIYNNTC